MTRVNALEWIGTGFGLMGSLSLAIIGAVPALLFFTASSTLLLGTALIRNQKSFVLLQSGFLFCNIIGVVKICFT